MKFIDIEVKTAFIVHGYDEGNNEIIEPVNEENFVRKIIAVERILSISEDYIMVTSSHGRVMYWEYNGTLDHVKYKLESAGCII